MSALPSPDSLLPALLDRAKRAGADAADALFVRSTALSAEVRLGKLEGIERPESQDLGLRVLIGQRQASISSTDLSPAALDALVERVIAMAKEAPEDRFAGLAPADRLARTLPDLDLADPHEPASAALIDRALACEDAGRAVAGITNSEGGGASWGEGEVALATTGGFFGRYRTTRTGVSVSLIAGTGAGMEVAYDYASARHAADLRDAAEVGRTAGQKAVARLNPRKVKTAQVPVVFDPDVSASLVGHFAGAINGAGIARGVSFLKGRLLTRVFAPGIRIVDDPHRLRGLASKPFDGEGVANRPTALIEDGVLTTWLLDSTAARQLGLATTGHAARGTGGPPSPSSTNLYMEPGTQSPAALMSGIREGLYVVSLLGQGVNGVTGDYSRGAAGFWIENGQIAFPVNEVTIAGNLKDMFLHLTPADDLVFRFGTNAPTLRVEGMTVAGS